MNKAAKISTIIIASMATVATSICVFLFAKNVFASDLSKEYFCNLPDGYSEIKNAIDKAVMLSSGNGRSSTDMKIRGTVTRVAGNSAYIQRVNQKTNELDAIQIYGINNHDDIYEGAVIDLLGGTIINYYGNPEWALADYSISFNENPYGYAPRTFYDISEFNSLAFSNSMNNYMYSCNKLVKIKNVKIDQEITSSDISVDYYSIRDITITDGKDNAKATICAGNVDSTNSIKATLNDHYSKNESLDIVGVLYHEGGENVIRILSQDDISLSHAETTCNSLSLSSSDITLKEGDTVKISAETDPIGLNVSFNSSNPEVASINERGYVTALKAGSATITAKCIDKYATCAITVTEKSSIKSKELTFLALNDFHGAVIPQKNNAGIVSVAGIMRGFDQDKTLFINSGDMFQGSIESNYNHGELLSKIINKLDFSASILGNHEFDWGDSYIKENAIHQGQKFLCANLYNYDIKTKTTLDYASDLASKYNIVTKDGLKIGLIGTIGSDQTKSITSHFIDVYTFANPIPIIKTLSDELRINHGCDVVVLSHHGPHSELIGNGLTSISSNSGARYIDAAFCGHTHQNESTTENGVSFIQTNGYGNSIGKTVLNIKGDEITTVEYTNNFSSSGGYDEEIQQLVDEYKAVSDVAGKEILTSIKNSSALYTEHISNLYNKAVYEAVSVIDPSIILSMGNYARKSLYASDYYKNGSDTFYNVTFANLYESLPFDNQIIIADVSGKDILKEAGYSSTYIYRPADSRGNYPSLDSNTTYRIAVLDYIGTHRNSNRDYDYFPSLKQIGITESNYREITADYLRKQEYIMEADYSSSISSFNKSLLS